LGAVLLAGCPAGPSSETPSSAPATSESSSTPASPVPSTAAGLPEGVSPFTGLPAPPDRPVLVVKIDNTRPARPHTGLAAADVVYVEPVEGGLSRLAAVFSTQLPPVVGPVRSARGTDLELLAQFGRPVLAYSGAAASVQQQVNGASVVPITPGKAPQAFFTSGRRAPYNLYARPDQLLAAGEGGSPARDIGFRFGALPEGGTPSTEHVVRYPAATVGFTWSPDEQRWLISMDGQPLLDAEGGRPGAATVVVQRVQVRDSGVRDTAGSPSPHAITTGEGTALVLRDGTVYEVRWSRPTPADPTRFTLPSGDPMPFAAGPVWVVLEPVTAPG